LALESGRLQGEAAGFLQNAIAYMGGFVNHRIKPVAQERCIQRKISGFVNVAQYRKTLFLISVENGDFLLQSKFCHDIIFTNHGTWRFIFIVHECKRFLTLERRTGFMDTPTIYDVSRPSAAPLWGVSVSCFPALFQKFPAPLLDFSGFCHSQVTVISSNLIFQKVGVCTQQSVP